MPPGKFDKFDPSRSFLTHDGRRGGDCWTLHNSASNLFASRPLPFTVLYGPSASKVLTHCTSIKMGDLSERGAGAQSVIPQISGPYSNKQNGRELI